MLQVCNHPLITYPPDGVDSSLLKMWDTADARLVAECGKMQYVDRLIVKFARTGHRVLLFSTMTKVLDLMEVYLRWRRIDGALRGSCRRRDALAAVALPPDGHRFCPRRGWTRLPAGGPALCGAVWPVRERMRGRHCCQVWLRPSQGTSSL